MFNAITVSRFSLLFFFFGDDGIKSLEFFHFYTLAGTSDDYPDDLAFGAVIGHWPRILDSAGSVRVAQCLNAAQQVGAYGSMGFLIRSN
jgi:hypothetical protein